ncbi:RrF2 family transcriptional regulator [Romboutsia lituseburensis]|uniref:RrF2 family transcriptional regulator n=1 Tax=Romboutsia lituseburensis TaxID=1537 RepID=UPI00215A8AFD|nr:Rrf2 family transcriptional regulator [Romboutsia lituseburensis]MCR8744802.1 Rrf2 family transcriptional regulator [Romboutsia lituseburensis]
MTLSKFSDYAFRILILLGNNPDNTFTVDSISKTLNLSNNHIKKIVYKLATEGYIESTKGRNGGIRLGKNPCDINLGELLKITEDNLSVVECFSKNNNTCNISSSCKLKGVIGHALNSFMKVFDDYTLADVLDNKI